jgi:hypothetical protein
LLRRPIFSTDDSSFLSSIFLKADLEETSESSRKRPDVKKPAAAVRGG